MEILIIPMPEDYAEAYPEGTLVSQCKDCGEIRVNIPGDLHDPWKNHADYCN